MSFRPFIQRLQPRRRALVLGAVYFTGVALLIYAGFSGWAYDDPFITYRYARNLAAGLGFVYNPGEAVLSTTTPLFALLLTIPARLGLDLPAAANAIGAASLAAGALLLWGLAQRWQTPIVGWAALVLYPASPLLLRTLSSETPLYIALCLGAILCYARQGYTGAGALAALAMLSRPDGGLVAALLAAHFVLFVRRPWPWRALGVFLALTLPWFMFAWYYFGSPAPLTLLAKQQQGAMSISRGFLPAFFDLLAGYGKLWNYQAQAVLALGGAVYLAWRRRAWGLFLTWTVAYFAAYTILGVSSYYWYYAPLAPGWIALVGLGLDGLWAGARRRLPAGSQGLAWVLPGVLLLALGAAQVGDALRLQQLPDRRVDLYRQVGVWINANTPPDASLGLLEAGIGVSYADRRIIDFAGLFQPELSARLGELDNYNAAARWAVTQYQPDWLVLQAGMFGDLPQLYPNQACMHVKTVLGADYDYPLDLEIYRCQ